MEGHPGDVAAVWEVRVADGTHKIIFEHGTTSGKRVINVDGIEVYRKNWMFRLVGTEQFKINKRPAEICITSEGMAFKYVLIIDGKSLTKFIEAQAKNTRVWLPIVNKQADHRVVLGTMDVYVDGEKVETIGEFTDDGCETHFNIGKYSAYIKATSSGHKVRGLNYVLVVAGIELHPVKELV